MNKLPPNKSKIPNTKFWNAAVTARSRVNAVLAKRKSLLERADTILEDETNDLLVYLRDIYGDSVRLCDFTGVSEPGKYPCSMPILLQRFDAIDCIDCFVDCKNIYINCTNLLGKRFCLEIALASPAKLNAIFIKSVLQSGLFKEEERWDIIREYCDVLTQFSTLSDKNGIFLIPPVKLLMDTPYTKRFYHISGELVGKDNSFIGINERSVNENLHCH